MLIQGFADLKKQGLLERNKQISISRVPLNIGLVTAFDSAAYHDFTNELRLSGFAFKVKAYNAHMQGDRVEADLLAALAAFEALGREELDLVVITRGGGSTADLSYFDNKLIAQRIAQSSFPVVTALGHQINVTIADMVAHTVCKTPTKGAQFLVEQISNFLNEVDIAAKRIPLEVLKALTSHQQKLKTSAAQFDALLGRYFRSHREELIAVESNLNASATQLFRLQRDYLGQAASGLKQNIREIIASQRKWIDHLESKVTLLDPRTILKRGYSITLKSGKAVKSPASVETGDILTTLLFEGRLISKVQKRECNNEQEGS